MNLPDEEHGRSSWGTNHVLLRADGHVARRGDYAPSGDTPVDIWKAVTGQRAFPKHHKEATGETELKVLRITKAVEIMAADEELKFAAAF